MELNGEKRLACLNSLDFHLLDHWVLINLAFTSVLYSGHFHVCRECCRQLSCQRILCCSQNSPSLLFAGTTQILHSSLTLTNMYTLLCMAQVLSQGLNADKPQSMMYIKCSSVLQRSSAESIDIYPNSAKDPYRRRHLENDTCI